VTTYIDTHVHLDLLSSVGVLLAEAGRAGVGTWVVPGVCPERWVALMAIAEGYVGVYAAPGIHPQASARCQKSHLAELERLLEHPRVVALGEVGLDRQVASPWRIQEDVFVQQIRLAREVSKPLLIHARRSTGRVLELLQQEKADQVGGIFHGFSGSLETARKIIDLGFGLGIGGVVTLSTAKRLPQAVRVLAAEALVLETDAPGMTPAPHQGQLNQPAYLPLIAERLATLRDWSLEETARLTSANARRFLRLSLPEATLSIRGNHYE
jgi:TatD DNase family protein